MSDLEKSSPNNELIFNSDLEIALSKAREIQDKTINEKLRKDFLYGFYENIRRTFSIPPSDVSQFLSSLDSQAIEEIDEAIAREAKWSAARETLFWFSITVFNILGLSGLISEAGFRFVILLTVFSIGFWVLIPLELSIKGLFCLIGSKYAGKIQFYEELPMNINISHIVNRNKLKELEGDKYFPHKMLQKLIEKRHII